MPATKNKEIVLKIYKIFETGEFDIIDKYIDKDVIEHTPDPSIPISSDPREYYKLIISSYRTAFPDIKIKILQSVVEGEKIATLILFNGTNTGTLMGIEPTNKRIHIECFDLSKFKEGKVVEHWSIFDNYLLLHQLGIFSDQLYIHAQQITAAREQNITES